MITKNKATSAPSPDELARAFDPNYDKKSRQQSKSATAPTDSADSPRSADSSRSTDQAMPNEQTTSTERKRTKSPKKKYPLVIFCLGLATLIAGIVVLCLNLFAAPAVRDAEYLVDVSTWQLQDQPSVVWKFTEVGKGTLTTNNHTNDYDFLWAIHGDEIDIETSWLYQLNDTYHYQLDQSAGRLILTPVSGDKTPITFVAGE